MTKYLQQSFSVGMPSGQAYRDNWDAIFAPKSTYVPTPHVELVDKAEACGRVVQEPKANELFLDIDSYVDLSYCQNQLRIYGAEHYAINQSKTPGHYHVIVTLDHEISNWERIALQAALGSDRKRELLAIMNATADGPGTNVLFTDPYSSGSTRDTR